jgi:hypothetical protein
LHCVAGRLEDYRVSTISWDVRCVIVAAVDNSRILFSIV